MKVTSLQPDEVFVFGSNLAGKHFGGAARDAYQLFGAVMGDYEGVTGQCYAIPTLDERFEKRTLADIKASVEQFIEQARKLPTKKFIVTPIGCGIAGFNVEQIAPMFRHAPANCILPAEFKTKPTTPKAAIVAAMLFIFGLQAGFAGQPSTTPDVDKLVTAIGKAENSKTHPYGIIAKRKLTEQEARRWCSNTVKHRLAEWTKAGCPGDPIDWIAKTYAPEDAKNDPHNLNRNWTTNVRHFYAKL